ncbi:class I SAM-dependent methyltransferase [Amylibacter sp.]|nr:class I SAM-dependent methyltransferase [Amylibacter sp.]
MNFICVKCDAPLLNLSNAYECQKCQSVYPVEGNIPRFAKDDYVSNFGFEWNIHKNTQMDDKHSNESQKHFEVRFEGHLDKFKDAKVLDVGVGVGRYAQIASKLGAKVVGIDLSSSVDVAKKNLSESDVEIVQADTFNLPFAKQSFDIIYSFGVLHHTPNPRLAFSKLVSLLKPGGTLCITVYEKGSMYHTSRYVRKITKRLPNQFLYLLCLVYVLLMYIPYKYMGLRYGLLGKLLPISLSSNLFEAILDTFDCYSPSYQFTYKESEIYQWFKSEGLQNIELKSEPVTVLGTK